MSTMIERIADFLKDRDENVLPGEADDAERLGSAAEILELMRQPTVAMEWAAKDTVVGYDDFACGDGRIFLSPLTAGEAYRAMINAALNEKGET